jgi:hypothetical protein
VEISILILSWNGQTLSSLVSGTRAGMAAAPGAGTTEALEADGHIGTGLSLAGVETADSRIEK